MFLICCTVSLQAQAWFCTDEGTDLIYTRYYVKDSTVKWHHTMSILGTSMDPADSSHRNGARAEIPPANRAAEVVLLVLVAAARPKHRDIASVH